MLITWMAYATVVAAAVSVAAIAIERIVAIWGGARRVVWGVALLLSVAAPLVVAVVAHRAPVQTRTDEVQRVTIDGALFGATPTGSAVRIPTMVERLAPIVEQIDAHAMQAWLGISTVLFCLFLRAGWTLRGRRAEWRRAEVDGCDVLMARDVGPAVIGAWRPTIVFPEWALALDSDEKMLMLQHEREHVAARDPLLLLLAGLALVCVPWNAALWLIVKRLRLAVEIDCDARVLRVVNRPREYGMLLLSVGARYAESLPYAASLAERRPLLERRIRAMTSGRPSRPVLSSLVLGVAAIATTALAAQAPRPKFLGASVARSAGTTEPVRRGIDHASMWTVAPVEVRTNAIDSTLDVPTRSKAKSVDSARKVAVRPDSTSPVSAAAPTSTSVGNGVIAPTQLASSRGDIPLMMIFFWIEQYQPDVIHGKAKTALVTIIVDANDHYVSSTTDRNTTGAIDSATAAADPERTLSVDAIANVEVVKGPAALAMYGDRAANGVIVITTKRDHATSAADSALARSNATAFGSDVIRLNANVVPDKRPLYVIDGVVVESPNPIAKPSDQLEKLGISSDGIRAVDVLHVPGGGLFGPNTLSIVIIKLKA